VNNPHRIQPGPVGKGIVHFGVQPISRTIERVTTRWRVLDQRRQGALAPLSRGSTLGSGQHSPPGQKLELEKRLAGNENLKKLARMIGRMKFPVAAPMFSGRSTLLWNACDRRNIKKAISFHHRRRMPGEPGLGGTLSQGERKTRLLPVFDSYRRWSELAGNPERIQRPDHDHQATDG